MSDTPNVPARPVLPGEQTERVSLREFEQRLFSFEQRINDRIRAERELIEVRSTAIDKALELQAHKYEARLQELNHAGELNQVNWRTSLPRELFDSYTNEWQKWRDMTSQQLVLLNQLPTRLISIEVRLQNIETALQQATGALVLIRFMGFAGVIALIVTFLRMANVIP